MRRSADPGHRASWGVLRIGLRRRRRRLRGGTADGRCRIRRARRPPAVKHAPQECDVGGRVNRQLVRLPAGQRKLAIEVLLGGSVVFGVLAWAIGLQALALAGLALLLSAGLMLVVQAPTGPVPLGYALIIALAALMPAAQYVGVVGLGVLATVPALAGRFGQREALARIGRWVTAATAAGVVSFLYRLVVTTTSPVAVLGGVVVIGVAFLYADQAAERVLSSKDTVAVSLRAAWPVDLALLCGAGLITLAY